MTPKLVLFLDRMRRASVEDATKGRLAQEPRDTGRVAGTFRLFNVAQIQMTKLPEEVVKLEPKPQDDWTVDYGNGGVPRPLEPRIGH